MNNWVKTLTEGLGDAVPEGWETTAQVAAQLGITTDATLGRLKRRLARGLVERKFLIVSGVGKISIWRVIIPEGGEDSLERKKAP